MTDFPPHCSRLCADPSKYHYWKCQSGYTFWIETTDNLPYSYVMCLVQEISVWVHQALLWKQMVSYHQVWISNENHKYHITTNNLPTYLHNLPARALHQWGFYSTHIYNSCFCSWQLMGDMWNNTTFQGFITASN